MRPISLTIEGLRSFRKSETFDFTGRDHIAIVGDTGAGKSSILEAMTYALYGQATYAGRNRELMNANETHMRVVFRFRVSDETWEVVRSVRRRQKGDLAQPSAQLSRVGEDGATTPEVEQVRRVDEHVERLLGLDCDAFLRTVILPQGRFARLLVEDRPADRSAILRQLWRTDELEAAGKEADKALQSVREVRIQAETTANGYPEDPEAHLERLRKAHAAASRQAEAAGRDELEAKKADQAIQAAKQEAETASGVRVRLDSVDLDQVAEGLAPLAERECALDREKRELEQRREGLMAERNRIPTGDGPTSEDVATALAMLPDIKSRVTAAKEAATSLHTCLKSASEKNAEAERLEQCARNAKTQSKDHAAARPPLEEGLGRHRQRLEEVQQSYEQLTEREADLFAAKKRLTARQGEQVTRLEILGKALERRKQTQQEAVEADDHLAAARRSDSAATAAHELHPGDSCPVCRRELPASWEAPAGTGLAEAERRAQTARQTAEAADKEVTRLDAQRLGAQERVTETEAEVTTCETQFEVARRELAQRAGLAADAPPPDRSAVLAPLESAKQRAEAALTAHEDTAKKLGDEATALAIAAQVGRTDAKNADETTENARHNVVDRFRELIAALDAVPEAYRPELVLPTEATEFREVDTGPIVRQMESAQARDAILKERQQETKRVSKLIDETDTEHRALARKRTEEIETPLQSLMRELQKHRDALVKSAHRLGLDREITQAPGADAEALEAHTRDLHTARTEIANAADRQAAEAADRTEEARARFRALGEQLSEPSGDPVTVLWTARQRAEEARAQERTTARENERFAAIAGDVRRLRTLLEEARRKQDALSDLAEALKPGRFLKWVTLRRSERLLRYASKKLGEVSNGRYSFVDPQETDEQWRILDNESNQPRSPASLSGGEQFLASLSLALGMVEMMERTGGHLESLFLDEGFGSLDPRFLDRAIEALKSAAERRMVAVISHIPAVAEQIDHVLAVSREATGSRAVWLSAHEREHLAASDAEASALSGSLE